MTGPDHCSTVTYPAPPQPATAGVSRAGSTISHPDAHSWEESSQEKRGGVLSHGSPSCPSLMDPKPMPETHLLTPQILGADRGGQSLGDPQTSFPFLSLWGITQLYKDCSPSPCLSSSPGPSPVSPLKPYSDVTPLQGCSHPPVSMFQPQTLRGFVILVHLQLSQNPL